MNIKKTKIVATLGPSTSSEDVLKRMIDAGVNVFRINFSHVDYDSVVDRIKTIRAINEKYGHSVAILADLQGPKLRVGVMKENVRVSKGDTITFITGTPFEGNGERVYMNYENFPRDVRPGEKILLDDGKLIFEVVSTDNKVEVKTKVLQGGDLKSKKGVNLPNTKVSLPALTEKDIKDAIFAIGQGVDWFALSFVRGKKDISDLKELIKKHGDYEIPIIAKIEKPEAVDNIDEILMNCDGIMVARGDLGVEVPAQEVPLIQKKLMLKAKRLRLPVIVATQMMESMIETLTPSRAEVNDVANSIMDGADAVMLSGETSVGKYPVEVVEKMASIAQSVEDSELIKFPLWLPMVKDDRYTTKYMCHHAAIMANEMNVKAITTLTNTGYTGSQISARRPNAHILVFTSNLRVMAKLSLMWGVQTFYYDRLVSTDETVTDLNQILYNEGFVNHGDLVISLLAMPVKDRGKVNTLRISTVTPEEVGNTKKAKG